MTEQKNLVPKRRFKEFQNAQAWENRELESIFKKIRNAFVGTATPYYVESGNFYLESNNVKNGKINRNTEVFINDEFYEKQKDKRLHTGDLVMVQSGHVGHTAVIEEELDGTAAHALIMFQGYKEQVDPHFLNFQFQTSEAKRKLANITTGNTIKHILSSEMKKFEVLIPSIEEQNKIGTFFKVLEDTIALQQRKLEKTKALKSAYLSEMFPAKGEREPKRRFAGFTEAWEQRTIGEFGYFYYGKSAPKWSVTSDAVTPCVRYGELYTRHKEKIDTIYSFTNIPKENLKFSTGKEVLVPRVGEDPLDFANCSWLSISGVAIGEMISVYNTKQNPLFTAYMFNVLFKYEFAKRVEGGNVSNLYYAYLENIPVSYPSIEEQEKIASFFDNLSNLIALHQSKLDKLQNFKKAFLNEMLI